MTITNEQSSPASVPADAPLSFVVRIPFAGLRTAPSEQLRALCISRQVQMLDGLTEFPPAFTLELRMESPGCDDRAGSVRLSLVGQFDRESPDGRAAESVYRDFAPLLPRELGLYDFRDGTAPDDGWPNDDAHIVEIMRQEELVTVGGDIVYLVRPFAPANNTFGPILLELARSQTRCRVSIVARPAKLFPFERDALREALSNLETPPSPPRAGALPLSQSETSGLAASLREQLQEGQRLLLVRVFITSDAPLTAGFAALVGSQMANQSAAAPYHAYRIRRPANDDQRLELLAALRDRSFSALGPVVAPPNLERLVYLFDCTEAASALHLPLPELDGKVAGLDVPPLRTRPCSFTAHEGTKLGVNVHDGTTTEVRLAAEDFGRHVYMIGQTGTGKSTLLREMILQDIQAGHGVGVIDPHGDLTEAILDDIPKERAEDVLYFDPIDTNWPVGLNLFDGRDTAERLFLVSEAVAIFTRMYGGEIFGPRIQDYFRHMALTLMEAKDGGALTDLVPLIVNKDFQKARRAEVLDPLVRQFWVQYDLQYDRERLEMIPYFAAKFSPFYAEPLMRNIIGQARPGWRMSDIMDGKKILLANLAKGAVGEENSRLLGMVLMSMVQTATMMRARRPKSERTEFRLYVDEFQNYVSKGLSILLSEGRKYGIRMVLANQFTSQLVSFGFGGAGSQTNLFDAITGNVGNYIVFRVGPDDASVMSRALGGRYSQEELASLPNFNSIVRLLNNGQVSEPMNMSTVRTDPVADRTVGQVTRHLSRIKYGRRIEAVESEIGQRLLFDTSEGPTQ